MLGLETSCDETSAAVLRGETDLLGHVILSQDAHQVYGGVVPELAARAHLQRIDEVVATALEQADTRIDDLDALAVTAGPGLIGALLVGVSWAKAADMCNAHPSTYSADICEGHPLCSWNILITSLFIK